MASIISAHPPQSSATSWIQKKNDSVLEREATSLVDFCEKLSWEARNSLMRLTKRIDESFSVVQKADQLRIELGQSKPVKEIKELFPYRQNLETLPEEIRFFKSLEKITLQCCYFSFLPVDITTLSNLTVLDLNNNKNLTSLPNGMENLVNLTTLIANNSRLITIPKEMGSLPRLTSLDLRYNAIESLPKELANASKLSILLLDGNKLKTLPKEFAELNLTRLSIDGNPIEFLPKEFRKFIYIMGHVNDHVFSILNQ